MLDKNMTSACTLKMILHPTVLLLNEYLRIYTGVLLFVQELVVQLIKSMNFWM